MAKCLKYLNVDLLLDDVVPFPEPLGLPDNKARDVALELQHHGQVAAPVNQGDGLHILHADLNYILL